MLHIQHPIVSGIYVASTTQIYEVCMLLQTAVGNYQFLVYGGFRGMMFTNNFMKTGQFVQTLKAKHKSRRHSGIVILLYFLVKGK
jgi:hypothetical protein